MSDHVDPVSDERTDRTVERSLIAGGGGDDTFPRQYARTQRFTLGEPRNLEVSADGRRVVFLRSAGGSDPVNSLWVFDVATGEERLVADARTLSGTPTTTATAPTR